MGKYRVVRELDRQKWGEFVYNHPHGNIFQTQEMYEVSLFNIYNFIMITMLYYTSVINNKLEKMK